MPYASQAQRRFMHARHPKIASRWDREYPKQGALPERTGPRKGKGKAPTRKDIRRQQLIAQFMRKQKGKHGS